MTAQIGRPWWTKPDPAREAAAQAKRSRKAAKRAEDARRTEEGRTRPWLGDSWLGSDTPRGVWDYVERYWCGHYDGWDYVPRWWQRLNDRRGRA